MAKRRKRSKKKAPAVCRTALSSAMKRATSKSGRAAAFRAYHACRRKHG